jgi:inorganic triphosphatase YgiF
MGVERELKFSMDAQAAQQLPSHPILCLLGAPPRISTLDSRYFDTADSLLASAGMALRLRQTGQGRVLTIKTAGADALGHARGEWEWAVADGEATSAAGPTSANASANASETLPLADLQRAMRETPLRDLVLDPALDSALDLTTLQARLRPVFGTRFERMAWTLDWRGSRMELALDQGACLASRGGVMTQAPICEMEIELIDGRWSHCWDLAWALAQDLPLHLSATNKAQRAAALLAGERPQAPAEPAKLPADTALSEAAQLWLSTACAQMAVWAERIGTAEDARDVHQFRVALRRLRTATRWLQPWEKPRAVRWFEAEWRWAMQLSGLVRDADVGVQLLGASAVLVHIQTKATQAWSASLQTERQHQWSILRTYLRSPRFGRMLLALGRWSESWPAQAPAKAQGLTLRDLAQRAIRQDHKRWRRALAACQAALAAMAHGDPATLSQPKAMADLHAFRIGSKRLRLSLERLGHALPAAEAARFKDLRKTTEELHAALGNWHDRQRLLDPREPQRKLHDELALALATQAQAALLQAWILVQQHRAV